MHSRCGSRTRPLQAVPAGGRSAEMPRRNVHAYFRLIPLATSDILDRGEGVRTTDEPSATGLDGDAAFGISPIQKVVQLME